MSDRPPRKCTVCQVNRAAWTKPRVDLCYSCLPGGPFSPPPCRACGSERYFSDGRCDACHPGGPNHVGSCLGCLAWGVPRKHRGRCGTCRWWHTHYPEGVCRFCLRRSEICGSGACRLCWHNFRSVQSGGLEVDLAAANRSGQQLFFANMQGPPRQIHRPKLEAQRERRAKARLAHPEHHHRKPSLPYLRGVDRDATFTPVPWRQLRLFGVEIEPELIIEQAGKADSELLRFCDAAVLDHAERHGWSIKHVNDVRRSLRLLEVQQSTPGSRFLASDVTKLTAITPSVTVQSTLDVLGAVGLLDDDRLSKIERYFATQFAGLPEPMLSQLRVWFEVQVDGSTEAPRRRPRDPMTTHVRIRAIAPALRVWASAGHESLAEITQGDVLEVLPGAGAPRVLTEAGLRSLFETMKARKALFANPMRGLPVTNPAKSVPLPLNTESIAAALNSTDPATALAVALVAFHGLRSTEVREIKLVDVVDGRLRLGEREIPLAEPVRARLGAWLDQRQERWPATANPYLLVNRRTAPRLTPVSRPFPWKGLQFKAQSLREDRILEEVRATGGDVRLVCELFGMSVEGAMRYVAALGHPAFTGEERAGS